MRSNKYRTVKFNKKNSRKPSATPSVVTTGIIHVHPKGFAFVTPDDAEAFPEDIFIPKHLKGNAIDGDKVEIAVSPSKKADKGPEGLVQAVLKRAKEEIVGVVWVIDPKGNYILYLQALGPSKTAFVKKTDKAKYVIGDRLLLKVKNWGDEKNPALCTVVEHLGSIEEAKTDILAAIKDFGIRKAFPKEVEKQVKQFSSKVEKKDLEGRVDLTELETFTIDPDTARDYDDALSLTENEKGNFSLGVHIADVSHYVIEGTPLDLEARQRSNSTYFPGQCVPMLPEELSNQLCSLKEKVIRLTISVLVELDAEGTLMSYKIVRSYIKSRKRFTYKEAKAILDGKAKSPHFNALKLMEKLCLLLKKKRYGRGSVDLSLPETVIKVDNEGNPTGYEIVEYHITHQLVEEFMLKANEIVAQNFSNKGRETIYRIHEAPGEENLEDFFALARALGFPVPAKPELHHIQELFERVKSSPFAEQLSVAYIRSMKLAIYSKDNIGHYGLALENYCHFTSPIRRYSDLIVHRLLFSQEKEEDLSKIAKECSDHERVSFKAEMSVLQMKKLRLFKKYHKEDPKRSYTAVITKIKPFGIHFEVAPIQYEGFIHISDLEDDYYEFNSVTATLTGQNRGKCYKIGTSFEVMIQSIDLIELECKWFINTKSRDSSTKGKKSFKSRKKS